MKVFIIANFDKKKTAECVEQIARIMKPLGCELLIESRFAQLLSDGAVTAGENADELLGACDAVFVIGGDGTIIRSALIAASANKPILGINVGRLGFTAGLDFADIGKVEKLVTGEYFTESRMVLDVRVYSPAGELIRSTGAINDAVITRGSLSRILDIRVGIGQTQMRYRADGLILATPTGSTAYSLSAGGPVVDPALGCIVMTPVCPHSLYSRSVIFPEQASISVMVENPAQQYGHKPDVEAYLTVDGGEVISVSNGENIVISRSQLTAQFISFDGNGFYDRLKKKFME